MNLENKMFLLYDTQERIENKFHFQSLETGIAYLYSSF